MQVRRDSRHGCNMAATTTGFVLMLLCLLSIGTTWNVNVVVMADTTVTASGCSTERKKNRKRGITRCKFNSTNLMLDTSSTIQFNVANGGKITKCNKKRVNAGVGNSNNDIWYGECDNVNTGGDANFIRRKDRNGRTKVYGSIHIGDDICTIQPNADGTTDDITCTPIIDFPSEDEPIEIAIENDVHVRNLHFGFQPDMNDDVHHDHHHRTNRVLYDDSGSNIDVMVVWTKQAECKVSKLATNCVLTATTESNMRGLIDLAVAETNVAFTLSGIQTSLRLVHAYRDPIYVESTISFATQLTELQSINDGKLDDVHTKRTLYGADMVQLFTSKYTKQTRIAVALSYSHLFFGFC